MAGFDILRWATTTMTDTQVKALPTTAITLVSAPGSGKAILPLYGGLFSKTASGAYTNIDAAGFLEIVVGTTARAQSPASCSSRSIETPTRPRRTKLPVTMRPGGMRWPT